MKSLKTKIILVFLIISFLCLSLPKPTQAGWWGEPMMAEIWKQTTEQMVKSIQDTILANLKMAALQIIQSRLMSLLQSTGSDIPGVAGYIISDWKMFIYTSASQYSNQVTNDFFKNLEAGSTSAMKKYVLSPAQNAVNVDYYNMRPDLQYYCPQGDPARAFSSGLSNPWKCLTMSAQPQNDLALTYIRALSTKQVAYSQEIAAKQAEGVAGQGYKSKEATASNGRKVTVPAGSSYTGSSGSQWNISKVSEKKISTPGSSIGGLIEDVTIRMKTQMLSMAQSVPEVATAMVNQMITQVIQQGVSQITNPGSSSGGFNMSSMGSQMQSLIQNGVRQVASPNTFFGSGSSGSNVQFQSGTSTVTPRNTSEPVRGGQD